MMHSNAWKKGSTFGGCCTIKGINWINLFQMAYNKETLLRATLLHMAYARAHTHTHKSARTHVCVHRWAPKTATMGNGEFPKPQGAQEGEGSHGKAGRLRAVHCHQVSKTCDGHGRERRREKNKEDGSGIIHEDAQRRRLTVQRAHEWDSSTQLRSSQRASQLLL